MSVLAKIINSAIVDKKDSHVEVRGCLISYRNAPHPSAGKAPSKFIMGKQLRAKVITSMKSAKGELHQEAMLQDRESRNQRKQLRDRKKKQSIETSRLETKSSLISKRQQRGCTLFQKY